MFGKKSLDAVVEIAVKEVAMSDKIAFTRRVMWRDLDKRIENIFNKQLVSPNTQVLGGFTLSQKKYLEPTRSSGLRSHQHLNSTHVSSGVRFLGLYIEEQAKKEKETEIEPTKLKVAYERNCQLWYSQNSSGQVRVFLAPSTSNAGEIEEKNIIIGSYAEPASISCRVIERHMEMFVKYCASTSRNNVNFRTYLYRRYLVYKDFRFRAQYRDVMFSTVERILIVGVPVIALWLTVKAAT